MREKLRKLGIAAVAALTFGGAIATASTEAQAFKGGFGGGFGGMRAGGFGGMRMGGFGGMRMGGFGGPAFAGRSVAAGFAGRGLGFRPGFAGRGLFEAANDSDAPTTHRSMFFNRSFRSAAAMNSAGRTSLPCESIMRTSTSNIAGSSPCRLATGCCTRRKRFSMRAALMCFTQTLSYDCTRLSLSARSEVTV